MLCWVSQISRSCWVSLCWMSQCWLSWRRTNNSRQRAVLPKHFDRNKNIFERKNILTGDSISKKFFFWKSEILVGSEDDRKKSQCRIKFRDQMDANLVTQTLSLFLPLPPLSLPLTQQRSHKAWERVEEWVRLRRNKWRKKILCLSHFSLYFLHALSLSLSLSLFSSCSLSLSLFSSCSLSLSLSLSLFLLLFSVALLSPSKFPSLLSLSFFISPSLSPSSFFHALMLPLSIYPLPQLQFV